MPPRVIRFALVGLMVCAHGFASTNNIVVNGSFEQGTSNWLLFGQGGGVQYSPTNNAADGTNALLVANRTNLSHCATQDVLSNLMAEGSGVFFGIEFAIKMAAPGSARMVLQTTDGAGVRSLILAEKIISSDTGRWVSVRGGRTIDWTGTLSLASLRFEIGQITERVYPSVILDRVRILRDSDRDGLTDDADAAPSNADANTNALPDGWEASFGLSSAPGVSDADADGFSNLEEYWAATNPTNALSRPGQPVNTNATPEARAFLRYLALLPSLPSNRVLVGQVVTDTAVDYSNQVLTLVQQTGRWPAMLGVVYDMINGPINHPVITPHATNWWNAGGVVHVQWNPDNPWNGGFSGNTNNIDFPSLFTPGSPSHTNYIAFMDEVAAGLRQLGNAGMTVLFRPLNECNSFNNWFQSRARSDYVALYRWTFDYLARSQHLNHVLWVYDSLSNPHQTVPVTYFYPGDDVVDVFGVNIYDDDWTLPFDLDRLSRDYPKPLAAPEGGGLTVSNRTTFTNLTYIVGISNNFPRLAYFNIYNSFPAGFNATNYYSLVHNVGASNLFDHPWIVTREDLSWRTQMGPFGAWQMQHFSTNANNPVFGGIAADPDADGSPNLCEYVAGSNPSAATPSTLSPRESGIDFVRNISATDVVLAVEWTPDLVSTSGWQVLATKAYAFGWQTNAIVAVDDLNDGHVALSHTNTYAVGVYRLRVTWP